MSNPSENNKNTRWKDIAEASWFLNKFFKNIPWITLYVLLICIVAKIVGNSISVSTEDSAWLGFWGSYLGGAIGCFPAILSLKRGRDESARQHQEVQEQLAENRKQAAQAKFDAEEARRCSVMPLVDVTLTPILSYPDSTDFQTFGAWIWEQFGTSRAFPPSYFTEAAWKENFGNHYVLTVRNIGLGPALNTSVCDHRGVKLFEGDVSASTNINYIYQTAPYNPAKGNKSIAISIRYQDVFSNIYNREYHVEWTPEGFSTQKNTSPTRSADLENSDILEHASV